MKTSIATVCLSGVLPEKLEAIAGAGFRAVEIFENDLIAFAGSPTDVRRMCADLGLEIVTCQPFRDFEGMPDAKRQRTFDRAERKFDLLQELGAGLLFVCSSVAPDAEGGIDRLAADFHELGERAQRRGLRVGYEALAWGRHISDYRDSWEVVRRADHPSVGLILDTFHIQARGIDLRPIRSIPGDRISFVQIADAPMLQMDYLSWARHWRCMPGQGDFDVPAFMDALATTGYAGHVSLEIFNDRFRAGSAHSVALDGHRSLIWLIDETSRRFGRTIGGAVAMPPPAPVGDVAFVEFAVDDADLPKFEAMLSAMGFARVRPPPLQERDALATGRHPHHRQQRQAGLRPFLPDHARRLGLRAGADGAGCARHHRPRQGPARHAAQRGGRAGRARHSGSARPRRQPRLFRRRRLGAGRLG